MNLRELESFKLSDAVKFHNELNPELFDDEHLDPTVREQLLEIAQDFMDHLGVSDLEISDITISGSNAAYTYTPHSDIDLHILVDIAKLRDDDIYRELFTAKKTVYNDTHDIKIHGYDVELYVQDTKDPVQSLGEYSVLRDKWIKHPVKRRSNFDEKASKQKFTKLAQLAQVALRSDDLDTVQHLLDTIKKYRQSGLDKHGEFGPENLAYKALRTKGIVDQLFKHRDALHAELLSLGEDYDPNSYNVNEASVPSDISNTSKLNFLSEMPDVLTVSSQFESYFKENDAKWYPHRCFLLSTYIKDYRKLMESAEPRLAGLRDFQKFVKTLDKRSSMRVRPGSKIGVIQFLPYTADNIIEVRGHKVPKTVKDIVMNPGDDTINYIEFVDGSTFPDKNFINSGRGNDYEGLSTLFFDTKNDAEHAVTLALLNSPDGWKISTANLKEEIKEASGYIPSESEKNDPRYRTALTVDVKPDSIKKNAKAFSWLTDRAGIPPTANPNGKIK